MSTSFGIVSLLRPELAIRMATIPAVASLRLFAVAIILVPVGVACGRASSPRTDSSRSIGTGVPHPYSTKPSEILANVRAAVQQPALDKAADIPELAMPDDELRAKRILDVTSLAQRPDYYVVELESMRGMPVAVLAITEAGVIMSVGDVRGIEYAKALDLRDAIDRAALHTRAGVSGARHVWAENMAEPGSSLYRPLAAVHTTDGTIYFNSAGDGFAESGSTILKEVGAADPNETLPLGAKQLRKLKMRE